MIDEASPESMKGVDDEVRLASALFFVYLSPK